jgi:putative DNA primase/helicase
MNEQEIAYQVKKRVEELSIQEEAVPLDDIFVKQCLDANERGDGVLFSAINQDKYIYNTTPKDGSWYYWKGHVWSYDDTGRSLNSVEDCAIEYQRMADQLRKEIEDKGIDKKSDEAWKIELRKKYTSRIDRLRTKNGADKALIWAPIVCPDMFVREDELDKIPHLLPVRNGVINLKNGALESGRQEDRLSRTVDIDYDPHADYTPIQDFIDEICDDFEVADFMKRSLGYAATGYSHEQHIWVFIGPGRNGKGVLFSLLSDILGPYYHEINRSMILEQKNEPGPGAASEHKYSLLCKRMVVGAETNKGQKIDAVAVKSLTGDDMINCRPNFGSEINFKPSHSIFLHTNNMPYGLTKEFSLIQRLLLIEFPYMYVDDVAYMRKKFPARAHLFRQKDKDLKEKLKKCRQGFLRWIVEGAVEWHKTGLKPPRSIIDKIDELSREEDHIGRFYDSCLINYPGVDRSHVPVADMYNAFRWWWYENMDENASKRPTKRTITRSLKERGHQIEKVGGDQCVLEHEINPEIEDQVKEYVSKHANS